MRLLQRKNNRLARAVRAGVAACALAWGAAPALAFDYLWLAPEAGGKPQAWLGELGGATQPPAAVADVKARVAGGAEAGVSVQGDHWRVDAAPASGDVRLSARRVLEDGALNYYQARLGRQDTQAVNDLELVPTEPGGTTFKLVWKGSTVAASQVNVSTSEGWRRTLKPAADGTVSLATPFPGLYVLEATARVNGSASIDGKTFDDVRHTATLAFQVE